jgi:hypothetical protein
MYRRLPWGWFVGLAPVCVDANDVRTQVEGLIKRLLRILPDRDYIFLAAVRRQAEKLAAALQPLAAAPLFEEWLASTSYPESRKVELRRVFASLDGRPPSRQQLERISSFIKTESYEEFKFARWINSRSDHAKVWWGPWCKAIEQQVYSHPAFIKHTPVPERPKLVAALFSGGSRYYSTDYSSFEAQITPELCRAGELVVYRRVMSNFLSEYSVVERMLTGKNRGRTRAGVSFVTQGRRMSGDMNTSVGNGISNLVLWSAMAEIQGLTWKGYVEGDDGIFAVQGGVPWSEAEWKRAGFIIKIAEFDRPELASFCGVVAADGQVVRDPLEFCVRFGWTSSFILAGDTVMNELLRAKALSAVYECPQCPVIGVLARKALEMTEGHKARFVDDGYHRPPPGSFDLPTFCPSPAVRALVAEKFGINETAQLEIERLISDDRMDDAGMVLATLCHGSNPKLLMAADWMCTTRMEEV